MKRWQWDKEGKSQTRGLRKIPLNLWLILQRSSELISKTRKMGLVYFSESRIDHFYSLINRCPPPEGRGALTLKFWSLLVASPVTNWSFSKIPKSRVLPFLALNFVGIRISDRVNGHNILLVFIFLSLLRSCFIYVFFIFLQCFRLPLLVTVGSFLFWI